MTMMTIRAVTVGGIVRHVPVPFTPPTSGPRKRKTRTVPDPIKTNGESAAEQLRLLIERVERLDEEISAIQDDRKDVLAEARGVGFDAKVILKIVAERKRDRNALLEEEAILETYKHSLGLL